MPMWYESCDNPQGFRELYASGEGLDRVRLFVAILHGNGPHLELRVELPRFPDHPPKRWREPDADRVQVTFHVWFVEDLRIEGWTPASSGLLRLERAGDALALAFESETVRITARCASAWIAHFSPYRMGDPDL
jgi:hypothetical protein